MSKEGRSFNLNNTFANAKQKSKDVLNKAKDKTNKYSKRQKIIAAAIAFGVIVLAIVIAIALNQGRYSVLFTGVEAAEAEQIIAKLQDDGISYKYTPGGDIEVLDDVVEQVRVSLVSEGYPKSGFTYDTYINNASGMTTATEKEVYQLYELQDRIGATIRYFEGVQDAKVTIALPEENKYILQSEEDAEGATASVMLDLEPGVVMRSEQAAAIQLLVARAVQGMDESDVGVFDSNGMTISSDNEASTSDAKSIGEEVAMRIENTLNAKITNVLAPFYGDSNIKVSVRAQVDVQNIQSESITYTTPEKIDENDKQGIVESEDSYIIYEDGTVEGGVPGTEENSEDIPQYNTLPEGAGDVISADVSREYLVNQLTEQALSDQAVLNDVSVSVAINTEEGSDNDVPSADLIELVQTAAGIEEDSSTEMITIVKSPFYEESYLIGFDKIIQDILNNPIQSIVIAILVLVATILLLSFLLKRARKRKAQRAEEALRAEAEAELKKTIPILAEDEEDGLDEILGLNSGKYLELKELVRGFANDDPEIMAQVLHEMLGGGEV